MRIIIEVPERGNPETTITGSPYLRRRWARFQAFNNKLLPQTKEAVRAL
jgi:hypothetical protein